MQYMLVIRAIGRQVVACVQSTIVPTAQGVNTSSVSPFEEFRTCVTMDVVFKLALLGCRKFPAEHDSTFHYLRPFWADAGSEYAACVGLPLPLVDLLPKPLQVP